MAAVIPFLVAARLSSKDSPASDKGIEATHRDLGPTGIWRCLIIGHKPAPIADDPPEPEMRDPDGRQS
jgi:hypothetical protein